MMQRFQRDILHGPLLPNVIVYTVPIILTSLLQLLFNAADLVIIGQFRGSLSVGAVGATGALTNLIITLFVGLSAGVSVTTAHAIGSGQDKLLHRIVHTALPTALISGALLSAVGVIFSEALLGMMGTPEELLALSATYMRIYFAGITFTVVYDFCAAILRAAGDSRSPLLFLTIAGTLNVLLNLLFVTAFSMNVEGVALATIISQAVAAALSVIALMRRSDGCRLVLSQMRFYRGPLLELLRIGIPAGIQSSLFAISNVVIQSSINSLGDTVVTGLSASTNLDGFISSVFGGFSQSAVVFTGQSVGAGQHQRVRKILLCCVVCTVVSGLATSTVVYSFGEQLLSFYLTDSPEAIAYAMIDLAYVGLPFSLCGIADVTTSCLRGMGASLTPMVISVLGVCGFRLLWVFTIFPAYHTLPGLLVSYPLSWIITSLAQLIAFFIVYRHYGKSSITQF